MKVLLIRHSEVNPLDGKSPRLLRTGQLAKYLDAEGIDVIWLTSTFNHFNKTQRRIKKSQFKLFTGSLIEFIYTPGYNSNLSIARLFDHFIFGIKSFIFVLRKKEKVDVIITSYPTITSSFLIALYGKFCGVPVIVDVRDKWPDLFWYGKSGIKKWLIKLACVPISLMAKFTLTLSASNLAPTADYLEFIKNFTANKHRVYDLISPLGYTKEQFEQKEIRNEYLFNSKNRKVVTFIGTIGRMFDFESIIAAAELDKQEKDRLFFLIYGNGDFLDYYKDKAKHLDNIHFPGWIDKAGINYLLEKTNVGLAPYKNTPNFLGHLPNKFFEYMAYGIPILTCLEGEAGRVSKNFGGSVYKEGCPTSMLKSLYKLTDKTTTELDKVKCLSISNFNKTYSSEIVYKKILKLCELLLLERK